MSEIWTAVRKEEPNEEDNPYIIFEIEDKNTGKVRIERRYEKDMPLMLELGNQPSTMAAVLLMKSFPWSFRKTGDNIYI